MRTIPCIAAVAAAISMLAACDHTPKEWKSPNMTALTPRLQAVFQETKTVCFGRFMVDVPSSTTVVWGPTDVELGISILPNGVGEVNKLKQKFIDELKNEKAINHDDVPMLLSVENVAQPEGTIVTGYEDFQSIDDLKINGYFKLHNDGVIINARPLNDERDETIADIKSIARRLRQRSENEIPTEPGNCIEYAFLADRPDMSTDDTYGELIRIGFRLKEFPDTHLSIFVGPSNPNYNEGSSLEWRLDRLEKDQKAHDPNNPLVKTKMLRRGPRQIHDWLNGFEALSRTPEQAEIHSINDFAMDFRGVPADRLKPYAEIQMQTGVADNAAGATKASLTDEEAIAVWDKITSTIRVRPTTAAPVKTSETGPGPRPPLGELAATGRICPQTGWWESDESRAIEGKRRQHIMAGERMPPVIALGEPSLWQKLKGKRPSYRAATVWKLVSYDNASTPANMTTQTATTEQIASAGVAGKAIHFRRIEESQNDADSPPKKG